MPPPDEDALESPAETTPPTTRPTRPRIWAWVLLGLVGAFALTLVGGLWFLSNLDHRWVKGPVEGVLSDLIGTDVSYEGLSLSPFTGSKRLSWSSPHLNRCVRMHLKMLRLRSLRMPIEFGRLFSGDIVIPEVRGRGVELTVVLTDDGRDSMSELFASSDEPTTRTEPSAPVSRSLDSLKELPITVGRVELAPIQLRAIEVAVSVAAVGGGGGSGVTRQTTLEPLGIFSDGLSFAETPEGSISIRRHGLNDIVLSVEEPSDSGAPRTARLSPIIDLGLEKGRRFTLSADVKLHQQSLFPELQRVGSLLHLDARADFDPELAQTTAHVDELALLDTVVVASMHGVIRDAVPPEDLQQHAEQASFSVIRLDGEGTIDAPSLPWKLETLTIDHLEGVFEVEGLEVRPSGVSSGTARLETSLRKARYDEDPAFLELDDGRIHMAISAPAASSKDVGTLTLEVALEDVRAHERGSFRMKIDGFQADLDLASIAAQGSGMWGLQGTGTLDASITRISVRSGDTTAASKGAVALKVDLGEKRVEGDIPIAFVALKRKNEEPIRVRNANVHLTALQPTHWNVDFGSPAIELDGSVDRVAVGKRHFRAPRWSLEVRRMALAQYAIDASVTADRVSWGKFIREPPSTLSLQAKADTNRPAIDADGEVAIAGRAPTKFSLRASQDGRRSRYDFDASGTEAGPLLGAFLFGDGGLRSDAFSFSLKSEGTFRGLAFKNDHGDLVVSSEPARTLRGSHRTELHVDHLSLLRFDLTHQIHDLTLIASSSHEAPGKGSLDMTTALARAHYGERERPMSLHHYAQELSIAYAALYGAPSFVIQTDGTLEKFEQPYVVQYPVANVSFGVDIDVDDTRVYAVREMYWRNPAGGSRFEARASYEGWSDALRSTEVCRVGTAGCPEVASMVRPGSRQSHGPLRTGLCLLAEHR